LPLIVPGSACPDAWILPVATHYCRSSGARFIVNLNAALWSLPVIELGRVNATSMQLTPRDSVIHVT
jgi:hypothetical protein